MGEGATETIGGGGERRRGYCEGQNKFSLF